MHDPTTLIFDFTGFSAVVPYELLEGQAPLLRLRFLEDPIHDCLARLWCSLASILSDSPFLRFLSEASLRLLWALSGMLSWSVLGVLWRASREHHGISLVRFLISLLLWGNHIFQESSMASQNAWYEHSCFGQGSFLNLFSASRLKDCLVY